MPLHEKDSVRDSLEDEVLRISRSFGEDAGIPAL